ncbi:hypothetical protein PanWU01x14_207540 [Parasponia andersonii]|uniref:Uncharacterized protein n=1 Tax=Parasponia andersonii TaxID=3476 RepID=A0A2P5BV30_PARAD|nr:hypothetical protein PanWU01x14_207540 [Parasponia andersonii]
MLDQCFQVHIHSFLSFPSLLDMIFPSLSSLHHCSSLFLNYDQYFYHRRHKLVSPTLPLSPNTQPIITSSPSFKDP